MKTLQELTSHDQRSDPRTKGIVPTMIDDAASATIKTHPLRRNIIVLEGSGGNIGVLTGKDGKLLVDSVSQCRSHGFWRLSTALLRTVLRSCSILTGIRITPTAMPGYTMLEP